MNISKKKSAWHSLSSSEWTEREISKGSRSRWRKFTGLVRLLTHPEKAYVFSVVSIATATRAKPPGEGKLQLCFVKNKPSSLPPSLKDTIPQIASVLSGSLFEHLWVGKWWFLLWAYQLVLPELRSADMAEVSLMVVPGDWPPKWSILQKVKVQIMLLHALMIHVSVLTHVCWPNSCNDLGHDCPPLFISAAEGMCPCISVSLAQSTAVSHKYFHPLLTLMCQNGKQSHVLCRLGPAVLPGSLCWQGKVG